MASLSLLRPSIEKGLHTLDSRAVLPGETREKTKENDRGHSPQKWSE